MIWILDTSNGCFEGESLAALAKSFCDHYGEDEHISVPQIESIAWHSANDQICRVSSGGVDQFEEYCEEEIALQHKEIAEHRQSLRHRHSDYIYLAL